VDETMEERFKTKVDNKAAFMVVRILFVIIDNDHQQKGGASLTA
jgi:hypothetical protein